MQPTFHAPAWQKINCILSVLPFEGDDNRIDAREVIKLIAGLSDEEAQRKYEELGLRSPRIEAYEAIYLICELPGRNADKMREAVESAMQRAYGPLPQPQPAIASGAKKKKKR